MNNPDSTTHKPRTAAEIAQELTVLTKALEEKKSIEERLVQIQAELAQAQQKEAREKSQKAASDRTKLVRRWYLHILLGEDWGGIQKIMNDTLTKRLAEKGYDYARLVRHLLKKYETSQPTIIAPNDNKGKGIDDGLLTSPQQSDNPIGISVAQVPTTVEENIKDNTQKGVNTKVYIESLTDMDPELKGKVSLFFQSGLDSLENTGISTWQQRIDPILTRWNKLNPELKFYKYQPGSNDKMPAGEKWKEKYSIYNQEDFAQKFSVVFPDWMKKKIGKRITPTQSIQTTAKAPEIPQTLNDVSTPDIEDSSNTQVVEAILALSGALIRALTRYKKAKTVAWNPENFKFHLAALDVSVPTKRVIHIELQTLPDEQKGFWRALISKDGIDLLRKEIEKIKNYTFKYDKNSRIITIQTGSLRTIKLSIPDDSALKYESVTNVESSIDEETKKIDLLKSGFYTIIEEYLTWFYSIHYKDSKIDQEAFTTVGDIVYRLLQANDNGENKKISGKIQPGKSWKQPTYQALQNVENIEHYFGSIKNGIGLEVKINKTSRESIKLVYANPAITGIELDFQPY